MASAAHIARVEELAAHREAGATWRELAAMSGWQPGSVKLLVNEARRGRLGLPTRTPWTEDMDALLTRHWDTRNGTQIARILSKVFPGKRFNEWSVNSRARRIGLTKTGAPRSWWTENVRAYP